MHTLMTSLSYPLSNIAAVASLPVISPGCCHSPILLFPHHSPHSPTTTSCGRRFCSLSSCATRGSGHVTSEVCERHSCSTASQRVPEKACDAIRLLKSLWYVKPARFSICQAWESRSEEALVREMVFVLGKNSELRPIGIGGGFRCLGGKSQTM